MRSAAGELLNVASAGSKPAGYVHPLAIQVMKEIGIDISGHHSKHMNDFLRQPVETVITVCGNADQACPLFPGQVNRHHWGFEDPAHATGTETALDDEALDLERLDRRAADRLLQIPCILLAEVAEVLEQEVEPVLDAAISQRLLFVARPLDLFGRDETVRQGQLDEAGILHT